MKHQKDITLRFHNYNIVFQEVPDEISLAINISGCPYKCPGCHSMHLREEVGEMLSEEKIATLLKKYKHCITCVCFMGGDVNSKEINRLANFVKQKGYKTAWYSGCSVIQNVDIDNFDYIKIGPYIEKYGGLDSKSTNQRFYKVYNSQIIDITNKFLSKSVL